VAGETNSRKPDNAAADALCGAASAYLGRNFVWRILKTESNRQDANRNSILICRQIGIGQPPEPNRKSGLIISRNRYQCAMYPGRRFALPWAISFCPFGAAGSMVDRAITRNRGQTPRDRVTNCSNSAPCGSQVSAQFSTTSPKRTRVHPLRSDSGSTAHSTLDLSFARLDDTDFMSRYRSIGLGWFCPKESGGIAVYCSSVCRVCSFR